MGSYHIHIIENASNLCMIITPWRKYCYKQLKAVIANPLDIFQQNMNDLLHEFEFICVYIDDIFILTKLEWTYHVHKLEPTLSKLKGKGLICNIEKSFFGHTKIEYLGLWVIRNVVKTINRNIEAIKNQSTKFPKVSTAVYWCSELLP